MRKKTWLLWLLLIPICCAADIYILYRLGAPGNWKLLFLMLALECMGIWYLAEDRTHYKADLITITPDIKTPAPAGQGQHGSARWLREDEYDKIFDSVVLTPETTSLKGSGLPVGTKKLKKNRMKVWYVGNTLHSLNIGATRSGKSRRVVMEMIGMDAMAGYSMIIPDVKGELYDYTAAYLREQDYEVIAVDFDQKEKSAAINLLQPVIDFIDAGNMPEAIDATWDIVSQMVGEAKGEKIWNDGECSTIAGAIMAVCYDNREGENRKFRNLTNVYYFLTNMCTPVKGVLPLQLYLRQIPDTHPAKGMFAVANVSPQETRGGFYTSAVLTLRLFTNPLIYNMTNHSDFSYADIGKRRIALFIILPEDKITYHSIATLLMTQIYSSLSRQAKKQGGILSQMVDFIWDEFGNFVKIPQFAHWLTVAGGKRIRFNLFVQDFAQLEKMFEKEDAKTIRNNCEIKIYLRSNDPDTKEEISKELNDYTTRGYSVNYGTTGRGNTGSSISLTGRRLLTSDEVGLIKQPYVLVMNSYHPAMMQLPDLSSWIFNEKFGMGDMEHNQQLRLERQQERQAHVVQGIVLWNIWKIFQDELRKPQPQAGGKAPEVRLCPYCKSQIPLDAVKCPHCTSVIEPKKAKA
mgnify:CR=1 FL=1